MTSEHLSERLADNLADNLAEQPSKSPAVSLQAQALVIGAGSAIAAALINEMIHQHSVSSIVAVSRQPPERAGLPQDSLDVPVRYLSCDYSAAGIRAVAGQLNGAFSHVFICTGVLHNDHIKPEKRIEDIDAERMAELLHINSILPALWLQALLAVIKSSPRCVLTVFSARVGSISDNQKGGWYSYRASKAALNMIVKTAAIEFARRAPGIKLLAFHPGTVDTLLSRPFQKNVAAEKLFTPAFVAQQLLAICAALPVDAEASYLDWAGEPITW